MTVFCFKPFILHSLLLVWTLSLCCSLCFTPPPLTFLKAFWQKDFCQSKCDIRIIQQEWHCRTVFHMWLDLGYCNAWTLHSFSFELRLTLSPRCRSGGSSEWYMSQPVTHLDSIWQPYNTNSVQSSFTFSMFYTLVLLTFTEEGRRERGGMWQRPPAWMLLVFNGKGWQVQKKIQRESAETMFT